MFCPECGTKVDDDALFCPECGTKLEPISAAPSAPERPQRPAEPQRPQQPAEPQRPSRPQVEFNVPDFPEPEESEEPEYEEPEEEQTPDLPSVIARGLILTNLRSLAKRLRVDAEQIEALIQSYIDTLRTIGMEYRLVDASNYTYKKKSLFGGAKHVSLNQDNAWYEYADLLKDMHDDEVKHREMESEWLFIIGGDEDVPMPCLPNFLANSGHDRDMDTDLLYAYPFGAEMAEKLMSQDLFRYDALFYVGRYPIASNGSIHDLVNYFNRVISSGLCVDVHEAYTQCDPHWRGVTAAITKSLYKEGFYPQYRADAPREILWDGYIFQTPYVMIRPDNGEQVPFVFNQDAEYLFFNMHGASERQSNCFYGASLKESEGGGPGMSPALISTLKKPNIIFTQACYGGRFIDYRKSDSMMLTAMSSQTLVYVGSSRVAYGAGDDPRGIRLSTSDILGKVFNEKMLEGYPAGRAFFEARVATYKHQPGEPTHALTIAEFNLYGDPLISLGKPGNKAYSGSKAAMLGQFDKVGLVKEDVLVNKSAGGPTSLLDQVRQAVDNNIIAISKVMAKQLYEQYNLPAREPSIITKRTFADGTVDLNFTYPLNKIEDGVVNEAIVTTDEKGEIQRVLSTK